VGVGGGTACCWYCPIGFAGPWLGRPSVRWSIVVAGFGGGAAAHVGGSPASMELGVAFVAKMMSSVWCGASSFGSSG
jgi:hypothetical protein